MNFDNFKVDILKVDMLMNRFHSTNILSPMREKIVDILDCECVDLLKDLIKDFISLTSYCVSMNEVETKRQILKILSDLDEEVIDPINLVEGKNVLESGHFIGEQKDLIVGYSVGDVIWFIDGVVYDYAPKNLIAGRNTLENGHFIGEQKHLLTDYNVGDVIWFIDGVVYKYEPKDLVEGENILTEGHFLGNQKDLITDYSVGDTIWFINGVVYDHDPSIISKLILTTNKTEYEVNEKFKLEYSYEPDTADISDLVFSSSDSTVCKIDSKTGDAECLKLGDFTLYLKSAKSAKSANIICKVIDKTIYPTKIDILNKKSTLPLGNSIDLDVVVTPSNAEDKTYTTTSANTNVIVVEDNNRIIAINKGRSKITVTTTNGISDSFECETIIEAMSIDVSLSKSEYNVGDTDKLIVVFNPSATEDKTLEYSSSTPSVATIDNNGNINFVGVGTTTFTAKTKNNKQNVVSVSVVEKVIKPNDIELFPHDTIMYKNENQVIMFRVLPNDAENKEVKSRISDTSVIEEDAIGIGYINAVGEGTATYTIICEEDETVYKDVHITVLSERTRVEEVELSSPSATLEKDGTVKVSVGFIPEEATTQTFTYTIDNPNLIEVTKSGLMLTIKALEYGEANITIITDDGKKEAKFKVTIA